MATVRITGGELGGRRITVPKVDVEGFRPATDRAKVAMFSTLHSMGSLEGGRVLELYAGTGALGFEALSRGAVSCTFVEQHPKLCRNIEDHIATFGVTARVVQGDVTKLLQRGAFLEGAVREGEGATLVIAGPPFKLDPAVVLSEIGRGVKVERGAVLVAVTERGSAVPERLEGAGLSATLQKDRSYGDSALRYYVFE